MPTTAHGTGHAALTWDAITAYALDKLENELVATRLVMKNLPQEFGKSTNGFNRGNTVTVPFLPRQKSASGNTLVSQPMVDQTTTITVDTQRHWGFTRTMVDNCLNLGDFAEKHMDAGVSDMAHQIDIDIITALGQGAWMSGGTPGTAISHMDVDYANAFMTQNGVPNDGMRSTLVDPMDAHNLRVALSTVGASSRIQESAIERAHIAKLGNMEVLESVHGYVHTTGARGGTPLVAGADQTGKTLDIDGASNSITGWAKKGDVFTIAGVYAVNPGSRQSTRALQQFVLTADASSSGTGTVTLAFEPEINDGNQTTVDGNGDTVSTAAWQTVDALPANDAAITFIGSAATTYRQAISFHKHACHFVPVPLKRPDSAVVKSVKTSRQSGITMLLTGGFDVTNYKEQFRIDVLYGVKMLDGRLGYRHWGASL